MASYLDQVIETLIPKPKITLVRLNEHGEELPSNIKPETAGDLIAYSIRDLSAISKDLTSTLHSMRGSADERQVLSLEQEIDILAGVIERLQRANHMVSEAAYGPEVMDKDEWLPASGGTETPFRARSGTRLLYVWNPKQRKHAYLNVDTDTILSDEEARAHLQTY